MLETPLEFYDDPEYVKYAQAWSMVHFLYGKHRALIEKYFDLLRARRSAKDAFDTVFKDKCGELETEWKKYVRALKP